MDIPQKNIYKLWKLYIVYNSQWIFHKRNVVLYSPIGNKCISFSKNRLV